MPWLYAILISFASTVQAQNLVVVGEGTARWGFIKLYDAKLKLPINTSADQVLSDHIPAQLELCYARNLSVKNFVDGANHALADTLSDEQQTAVNQLHEAYQAVSKNDCYILDYQPEIGTGLILNGQELVRINTAGFKSTYFGIWLGNQPLSDALKRDLLRALADQDN